MIKFRLGGVGLLALAATLALPLRADPKTDDDKKDDDKKDDTKAADAAKADAKADEDPVLSVTAHSVTVDGQVIKYHATAGYIVLKEEEGKPLVAPDPNYPMPPGPSGDKEDEKYKNGVKPTAKVFFVAYTLDDVADITKRPITYLFNGGPGSSSVWLHMGSVAPRRAALTDEGEAPPPPYGLMDNASTWLDKTDLVFIDPVSTGYSRSWPKEDPRQFHGLKEDIASVGDFIRLYTSRNSRWLSPKIVLGESYGTTRAAGLSDYLQSRYGLYLNGIILIGSALNFESLSFTPEATQAYSYFIPTFATTAWYHQKLSPEMEAKSVAEVAQEARAFAGNEYALALLHGDTLSAADRDRIAGELSHFTGIPASEFKLRKLRLQDVTFFGQLLRDEGRYLGRFDSRFTGLSYAPGEPSDFEYDPSDEAVSPTMTAAFNDYVRRELKYESDIPYETAIDVTPWNFGDAGNGFPNTAEDLRKAMTRNPYLKVWVSCSYYDLATPFFAAENVVASMNLDPSIRANLRFTYYESGHMLYIHNPSRIKFKADFIDFLNAATTQAVVHTAARVPRAP
jgi:carboxypeptidase C (cathepsin A)